MTLAIPDETLDEVARRAAALVVRQVGAGAEAERAAARWVDKRGAAEHLSFSVSKIEKLTAANTIPHHHHGGRVHYRTDELDEWRKSF